MRRIKQVSRVGLVFLHIVTERRALLTKEDGVIVQEDILSLKGSQFDRSKQNVREILNPYSLSTTGEPSKRLNPGHTGHSVV